MVWGSVEHVRLSTAESCLGLEGGYLSLFNIDREDERLERRGDNLWNGRLGETLCHRIIILVGWGIDNKAPVMPS